MKRLKRILSYLSVIIAVLPASCHGGATGNSSNEAVPDTLMGKRLFPVGKDVLISADGVISIVVGKNKSLWLWGDSFIGESKGGDIRDSLSRMVLGNVFVLLDGDSARTICGGTPGNPLPVIAGEPVDGRHAVYWPHHGFLKDGVLHLFTSNIVFGEGGMWDFHCRAVAYFRLSYPGFKIIDRQEMDSYPINQVAYGYGLHEYQGYYYFYGNLSDGFAATLHAGRARLAGNRLQDWEYFDGTAWTSDPSKTAPLEGVDVPVSSQFSIFKYKRKYILLTQEKGIGANDIYTFVADSPTGPWYNKKKIYSTPEPVHDKNLFAYNAMAHPQYDRDEMLLVSYCLNTHQPTLKVSDYRPRFIRVSYELIVE
ncbi:MAG: DUF4185 domain-containing protein [Bacteroidales bacterium]|jgi:hypothetical protein|nr:DUF4185 domain-containing protein [Bacteroidales bacterium]